MNPVAFARTLGALFIEPANSGYYPGKMGVLNAKKRWISFIFKCSRNLGGLGSF